MSRKFDLWKWKPLDASQTFEVSRGLLQVLCSQDAALYLEATHPQTGEVREVLASVGKSHVLDLAEPVACRLEGPAKLKASIYDPDHTAFQPAGEVFTNIDRKPHESGTVAEVRRAVREERLRMAQDMRSMREATKRLKDEQRKREAARQAQIERDRAEAEALTNQDNQAKPEGGEA